MGGPKIPKVLSAKNQSKHIVCASTRSTFTFILKGNTTQLSSTIYRRGIPRFALSGGAHQYIPVLKHLIQELPGAVVPYPGFIPGVRIAVCQFKGIVQIVRLEFDKQVLLASKNNET